jgi:large subunit ribosomal protein L19
MKTTIKLTPVDMKARKELDFSSGDTIRVWNKIKEADGKTRLQAFEGMVLARKHGTEMGSTFTVRKVTSGVGVERVFPLFSVMIDKIEIVRRARTRRSKLYYVRDKALRDVRRKLKKDTRVVKKSGVTTIEAIDTEEVAAE